MTRAQLIERAVAWLWTIGCKVVLPEFGAATAEKPDAIGFTYGGTILIECKVSRADFFADQAKWFRKKPHEGLGDWRFYLTPRGLIKPEELPEGWGLLEATPHKVFRIAGVPNRTRWPRSEAPFKSNRAAEHALMFGILRKATLKGLMPQLLETIDEENRRLAAEQVTG